MVRMRDVLKSVRDVVPGARQQDSDKADAGSGYSFPGQTGEKRDQAKHSFPDQDVKAPDTESGQESQDGATYSSDPNFYLNAIDVVEDFLACAAADDLQNLTNLVDTNKRMIESLKNDDELFLQCLAARDQESSLAQHSVNVAIVVIKMALGMSEFREEQVEEVGLSALVHEVGMIKVPEEILNKKGELTSAETRLIKQHPVYAKAILDTLRDEYPYLPVVVSQEHERWDGNGYPYGLKADNIHLYAQVIGISDTFFAYTHERHYRDNFIAYKAIQSIIERRNKDFSAAIIKALIDVISLFPVGSLVKLNDGSVARVIKTHKDYPIRPTIEIIQDAQGHKMPNPPPTDLSRNPMIHIVSPILDVSAYQ